VSSVRRVKVLLLIESLKLGGAQKTLYLLVRDIDRSMFEPVVVTFAEGLWSERIRDLGVPVIELPWAGLSHARRLLRLVRVARDVRPDVLHTFLLADNLYGTPAARLARVPAVVASRRYDPNLDYPGLAHRVNRALWWWADAIVCNNARAQASAPRGLAARHVVIPNAVELTSEPGRRQALRRDLGFSPDAPVVANIGRIVPAKNHRVFLRVAQDVGRHRPDARFLWIGGGPLEADLRAGAAELGLGDRVTVTGEQADAAALLDAADVFLLTSDREGMPNAVMEAMAARLPCVVTDAGGNAQLVRHGSTGYVCPVADVRALGAAVTALLDDDPLRHRFGDEGRRRMETHFSVERMVRSMEELYRGLTGTRVAAATLSLAGAAGIGARS
jgi:glycosyltransferase involved in cell wall biosynthesis